MIFKRFKTGDALHKAVSQETFDKIFNILEDTVGEGCEIERNGVSGLGWKIVVPEPYGDADEDVVTASTASIEVRRDEEGRQVVFALKGFGTEEQAEGDDLGEVAILARSRDGGKAALVYLDPATAVPVDSAPAGDSAPSSISVERNAAGELALHGIGSLTPKTSFDAEERGEAALVYVDTAGTPEVKYAALDAVVATDAEASSPATKSVEKSDDGELRLYDFADTEGTLLPTSCEGRVDHLVLARDGSAEPSLEYVPVNHLVLCDSEEESPPSRSLKSYGGALGLYDFHLPPLTTLLKWARENSAVILRDNTGNVPKLLYATLPAAVPTDDSGSASKSITRNTDGELSLYRFLDPSGGEINAKNSNDYYVLCRAANGTALLQRKLGLGGTGGYTGSLTMVSEVKYSTSTHRLEYSSQTLSFENGLLKTVTANGDELIDEAVEETI